MSINLTYLRSFHAVAREGSFTAAAEALRVTQPTLTSQVQAFERAYGVELFLRRRPPFLLSPLGQELFEVTQRLFGAQHEAESLVTAGQELRAGELRIGSVSPQHVADMLAHFHARHPGIYVNARITNSDRIAKELSSHQLDVAVLSHADDDSRFTSIPYRTDPIVVFAHRDHPLAKRDVIKIADLDGQAMVMRERGSRTRQILEGALSEAGVRVRVAMEVQGREALRAMVIRGIGLGVVSLGIYEPHPKLSYLELSDCELRMRTFLVFMRERGRSALIRAFVGVVSDLAGNPACQRRATASMA